MDRSLVQVKCGRSGGKATTFRIMPATARMAAQPDRAPQMLLPGCVRMWRARCVATTRAGYAGSPYSGAGSIAALMARPGRDRSDSAVGTRRSRSRQRAMAARAQATRLSKGVLTREH
jgi:hypothetical protein